MERIHSKKLQIFLGYLDEILPEFRYKKPNSGIFIHGKLLNVDILNIIQKCTENSITFISYKEIEDEIKFNFINCSSKDIYRGLKIIAEIINTKEF